MTFRFIEKGCAAMWWSELKSWLMPRDKADPTAPTSSASNWSPANRSMNELALVLPPLKEVRWLPSSENPWGVPVVDVRPVTLGCSSSSDSLQCAANLASHQDDQAPSYSQKVPNFDRIVPTDLEFRVESILESGALFLPSQMEDKWAIYFHQGQIIFVRSWTCQVIVSASTTTSNGQLKISSIRGGFISADESPKLTTRMLDFLLRSYVLQMVYPAPFPLQFEHEPQNAALWCMSCYGRFAQFGTTSELSRDIPKRPIRTLRS